MATLYYESELTHHGVKGQKKYQHKFGNWERHAKYANGQPDPNGRGNKKPFKETSASKTRKTTKSSSDSSSSASSVLSKANGAVHQFMVRQKKKAAAAKQRQYKKDLQERLAAATSSPEEMARFKKTATDAELRALQKRLDVYKALNKATPDSLKKKEETPEERNKRIADLANSYASGYVDEKELSKEDREAMYDYMDRENAKSREQKRKQAESEETEEPEERGSASNLLSNIITSNMKDEDEEKAFHNLFKITKPSFSSQVARDRKLQKKLIKACKSPRKMAAFKKAATNAELQALEERIKAVEKAEKATPTYLKSKAELKRAKDTKKEDRENMSAEELRDLVERTKYLNELQKLDAEASANKAERILRIAQYGPAITSVIDVGNSLVKAGMRAKYNKDIVDKINSGEKKENGKAYTFEDLKAEEAKAAMGATAEMLGAIWKVWQGYPNQPNSGGNKGQQQQQQQKKDNNPNNQNNPNNPNNSGNNPNYNKDKNN